MLANLWKGRYRIAEGTRSVRIPNEEMISNHNFPEGLKAETPQPGSMGSHQVPVLAARGSRC